MNVKGKTSEGSLAAVTAHAMVSEDAPHQEEQLLSESTQRSGARMPCIRVRVV